MASPSSAAWCISFFGIQPTLTQVPPSPQRVPCGDGFTKSSTATLAPSWTACFAQANPPEPPPMTTRS
uniref:Putative secreted peptide n=1 Tax=Anopheles braziliensis TaxID=58242 RepID=A0A2M3ZRT9_9DIPT